MAKREPHWVKLFLRELSRTGNVRMAAEAAGVDFTTAYGRRKRHADFAEAWEASLAASREAGPVDQTNVPAVRPSAVAGGDEIGLRPDGKCIRIGEGRWGKRAEEAFVAELTMSANVKRAAAAAGFSPTAVYKRRVKDRHLAAAWDTAIEVGKVRVQAFLVEAATRTFDPDELPMGGEGAPMNVSISEAINIAKLKACGPVSDWREPEEYDEDHLKEVRERILEKLARLRERDLDELGEAGWIEWDLPPRPNGKENLTVWLPPEYRLVGPEA